MAPPERKKYVARIQREHGLTTMMHVTLLVPMSSPIV
jgi:hypothetical protein